LQHGTASSSAVDSPGKKAIQSTTDHPETVTATWICPICSFSNPVPTDFDPSIANANTPIPSCLACGIKPALVTLTKAAIAALSKRSTTIINGAINDNDQYLRIDRSGGNNDDVCPRCTFHNHPSLVTCEMCGSSLQKTRKQTNRNESPAPVTPMTSSDTPSIIKLSFRAGGEQLFYSRLKEALVQRKWLLTTAPPIAMPLPTSLSNQGFDSPTRGSRSSTPNRRAVGIAGLEDRGQSQRQNNAMVIGSAFEDLEALMISAKEVIAMAERFALSTNTTSHDNDSNRRLLYESASALGLMTTKSTTFTSTPSISSALSNLSLSSPSTNESSLYITQLSRTLAEILTDDTHSLLSKSGGIISLVDLWSWFNSQRNGIELVSPSDFSSAAEAWETLNLPLRVRKFKSGLKVVQDRNRSEQGICASLIKYLQDGQSNDNTFGRGVTAIETANHFGWSIGVATEELEMAEDRAVLVREMNPSGVKFWKNPWV